MNKISSSFGGDQVFIVIDSMLKWSFLRVAVVTSIVLLKTTEPAAAVAKSAYETLCICKLDKCTNHTYYGGPESQFKANPPVSRNFQRDFRFHALIVISASGNSLTCSGTMLNDRWLVTTRTCFEQSNATYDEKAQKYDLSVASVLVQREEKLKDWRNASHHDISNHHVLDRKSGDLMLLRLADYQVTTPTVFACLPSSKMFAPGLSRSFYLSVAYNQRRTVVRPYHCEKGSNATLSLKCYLDPIHDIDHGSPLTFSTNRTKYHLLTSIVKNLNFREYSSTSISLHRNWIMFHISHSV